MITNHKSGDLLGSLVFGLAMAVVMLARVSATAGVTVKPTMSPEEMRAKSAWISSHLTDRKLGAGALPFTFVFDGKQSGDLLAHWPHTSDTTILSTSSTQRTDRWKDPKTGLEVCCVSVEYADFPVAEWTVYFKNGHIANTPILEKIKAIDAVIPAQNPGGANLHFIDGDGESHGSLQFAPRIEPLVPSIEKTFAPLDGRPTDGCFPYYNLDWSNKGVIVVLGWPGQWSAALTSDAGGNVHVSGGQELTHLTLHPNEEIRTPRVVMLFWKGGSWINGQNVWRRWMRSHNMPKPGGHDVPVLRAGGGFMYDKLGWGVGLLNEKDQITMMDRFSQEGIKLNTWWIDILGAGIVKSYVDKYITQPSPIVTSWDTDLTRFPHGIKAVSEHGRPLGEKLLVWVEPEHVWETNVLFRDHPEWLLSVPDDPALKKQINQGVPLGNRRLLNLGNPAACDWITNRISRLISEEDIGIYRNDFNITPLIFWHANDAPDRQGITENLYVQGYLQFFDQLLARHPSLLIDTCASGGRRDDIETLRRAVPLWRSDLWGPNVVQQTQTSGLALWIPYFGTGTNVTDQYSYRSSLGSSLVTSWDVRDPNLDYAVFRKLEAEYWKAAPFFTQDYYPLTPFSADPAAWMGWQFNRPEQGDGLVQGFRHGQCETATTTVHLSGLDPAAQYTLTNFDAAGTTRATGKELMETGLTLQTSEKPGSVIITYAKLSAKTTRIKNLMLRRVATE